METKREPDFAVINYRQKLFPNMYSPTSKNATKWCILCCLKLEAVLALGMCRVIEPNCLLQKLCQKLDFLEKSFHLHFNWKSFKSVLLVSWIIYLTENFYLARALLFYSNQCSKQGLLTDTLLPRPTVIWHFWFPPVIRQMKFTPQLDPSCGNQYKADIKMTMIWSPQFNFP